MEIKIINKSTNPTPEYKSKGAAGFDLASNEDDFVLQPGERKLVSTGLSVELPEGYEMQIRSRSGMALKNGITVLTGTIDSDYRGPIGVVLYNSNPSVICLQEENAEIQAEPALSIWNNAGDGFGPCIIKRGDRIAQGVISKHETATFVVVENLSETERGEGGFGSTSV